MDGALREAFELWPAWEQIVGYVCVDANARTVEPQRVFGAACGLESRCTALLYAYEHGRTFAESRAILNELMAGAREGRRPRFCMELGITRRALGL